MSDARPTPSKLALHALHAAVVNTVIALGLTAFGHDSLGRNLVYSQLIGMSIWAFINAGRMWLIDDWVTQWQRIVFIAPVGIGLGYFTGMALSALALGTTPFASWGNQPRQALGFLGISLAAGGALTYYFTGREHVALARQREAELRREAAEAKLKLLEAQLAPHMLFNTLANLRALIGVDPARAQQMLDHLNAYLRATLGASRAVTHPLAAEFERLSDYLALMAIRMGPRLAYRLALPPELAQQPVPTLLLQPLVENSIRHGLEPKLEGGSVCMTARREEAFLVLEVADDGVGLSGPSNPGTGLGLNHVRERLHTLYGPAGTIELIARSQGTVLARVRFPLKT